METATCTKCRQTLPVESFALKKSSKQTRRNRCEKCAAPADRWARDNPELARASLLRFRASGGARSYHLRKFRGITPSQYEQMLAEQGGACAICGIDRPGGRWKHFHVDHCHQLDAVRGLLCTNCNRGLGYFGDRPDTLMAAAEYLR